MERKAFKLFSDGKKPVEVAITLDIKADYVNGLYRKYWELNQIDQLVCYIKNKALHSIIFKLHLILRGNGMDQEKDVINVLKYANELPYLENSSTTIGS